MANVGVILDRLHVEGDDVVIEYDVPNVPPGTTLTEALMAFFPKNTADSIAWVFIDLTLQAAGQITDAGAGGTGHLIFRVTGAESTLLETKWRDYVCRVKLSDGAEYTIESGDIRGEKGFAAPVQASAP